MTPGGVDHMDEVELDALGFEAIQQAGPPDRARGGPEAIRAVVQAGDAR